MQSGSGRPEGNGNRQHLVKGIKSLPSFFVSFFCRVQTVGFRAFFFFFLKHNLNFIEHLLVSDSVLDFFIHSVSCYLEKQAQASWFENGGLAKLRGQWLQLQPGSEPEARSPGSFSCSVTLCGPGPLLEARITRQRR